MGTHTLTSDAKMKCPHGASITATPTEQNVKIDGKTPLKATDTFTVSGCQFKITAGPATIPSPCTTVVWAVPNVLNRAGMMPPLSTSSVGLCIGLIGVQGSVQVTTAGQTVTKTT